MSEIPKESVVSDDQNHEIPIEANVNSNKLCDEINKNIVETAFTTEEKSESNHVEPESSCLSNEESAKTNEVVVEDVPINNRDENVKAEDLVLIGHDQVLSQEKFVQ